MAKTPDLYCSFCRKHASQVDKLVAGPGVYICDTCADTTMRIMQGKKTAGFPGWETLDDETLLSSLGSAGACLHELDKSVKQQVDILRDRYITWQRIADALGVTRQAAQQRFS